MTNFVGATLRLKQQLGIELDKDVASLLGMTPRAWAGRKKAGSFPETELYALVAKKPDLPIDVAYVLTGERLPRHATQRVNHMAQGAGTFKHEVLEKFVGDFIAVNVAKNQARKERYLLLLDTAEHCSDDEFDLLLKLAESLRLASVAKSRTNEP